jgi:cell division protein FtsW (lipid II flippase)
MKISKETTAMLLGLLLLNHSSIAQQHNKEISMSVYPWYLESWVWVTAGLILGALVVSALRGDIRERR